MTYEFEQKDEFVDEWAYLDERTKNKFRYELKKVQADPFIPEFLYNEIDGNYKIRVPGSKFVLLYIVDRPSLKVILMGISQEIIIPKDSDIGL